MVQPRMAFGSLLLIMTLVTAACAERETARAGTEPSGTHTETAERDAPTNVFPTSSPHALADCPVDDEAFCRVGVEMVNAIEAGDAETIVQLSRSNEYDCSRIQSDLFPGCVTTDVVLDGYTFAYVFPSAWPTTDVLSRADYLARLEVMFASVDISYEDKNGGGAPAVVGVKKCGGGWTITWTAAWSDDGAPVQRMAGFFEFVVQDLGSDEWFTEGAWTMPLAYPESDWFREGDPPLDEIACGDPTMPWPVG